MKTMEREDIDYTAEEEYDDDDSATTADGMFEHNETANTNSNIAIAAKYTFLVNQLKYHGSFLLLFPPFFVLEDLLSFAIY